MPRPYELAGWKTRPPLNSSSKFNPWSSVKSVVGSSEIFDHDHDHDQDHDFKKSQGRTAVPSCRRMMGRYHGSLGSGYLAAFSSSMSMPNPGAS